MCFNTLSPNSQVSSLSLLPLNSLEQPLEVPGAEPVKLIALDDLNEHSWPVHHRLSEYLQQIPALIEIDEDVEFLQSIEILLQLEVNLGGLQPEPHGIVVCVRDADEVNATLAEVGDGR